MNISDGLGLEIDTEIEEENDDWEEKEPNSNIKTSQNLLWIDFKTTIKAQNKLIKIFRGEVLIPKQK